MRRYATTAELAVTFSVKTEKSFSPAEGKLTSPRDYGANPAGGLRHFAPQIALCYGSSRTPTTFSTKQPLFAPSVYERVVCPPPSPSSQGRQGRQANGSTELMEHTIRRQVSNSASSVEFPGAHPYNHVTPSMCAKEFVTSSTSARGRQRCCTRIPPDMQGRCYTQAWTSTS